MLDCILDEKVYWDNYSDFLLSFARTARSHFTAVPTQDRVFAAWRIFLLVFDSLLASLGSDFLNLIANSLSSEVSDEDRATAIIAAKAHLRLCAPHVLDHLHHQIFPLADHYSDWLVRLIDG